MESAIRTVVRLAEEGALPAHLQVLVPVANARAGESGARTLSRSTLYRWLDQAKRSYLISEKSVQLNERRVEEQNLRAELGTIRAQDQIDAQNALLDAQNQRAQNLVNHLVARLGFWNNLGLLAIRPDGKWDDLKKPATP